MSVIDSSVQWYIARDGQQHGPLSDAEMRKLAELGHLRQTDLVWRQGFPDWRSAPAVFQAPAAPPAAAPPSRKPAETTGPPQNARTGDQQLAPRMEARRQAPFPQPQNKAAEQHQLQPQMLPGREPANECERQPSSGHWRTIAVAGVLLTVIGAGSWFGYQNRERLLQMAGSKQEATEPPIIRAAVEPSAVPAKPAAVASHPVSIEAIDAEFQKTPLWVYLKQQFPDWYAVRLRETARLADEKKTDAEIAKITVDALVALRRENAQSALSASATGLKNVAAAFLENLRALQAQSIDACFAFISGGEASPAAVEMMQKAETSSSIHAQLTAVFTAVVEGRTAPVTHTAPQKQDYDMLAAELGKLGWSREDIQLFADPKSLAQAPRDRVCRMVQDWFTAHLAIQDGAAQERLLFETIRPVVAG